MGKNTLSLYVLKMRKTKVYFRHNQVKSGHAGNSPARGVLLILDSGERGVTAPPSNCSAAAADAGVYIEVPDKVARVEEASGRRFRYGESGC